MFTRKPLYTTDDLNAAVQRLEALERLRDKALQLSTIHAGKPEGDKYKALYEGYLSNTRTAQLYLDAIQMKGSKT